MCTGDACSYSTQRKAFIAFGELYIATKLDYGWEDHYEIMRRVIHEQMTAGANINATQHEIEDIIDENVSRRVFEFGFVCEECGSFTDKNGARAGE